METITVQIGGEAVEVPTVLPFADLRRAWPAIKQFRTSDADTIDAVAAAVRVVSAAVIRQQPRWKPETIEDVLRADEWVGLIQAMVPILTGSGLLPDKSGKDASTGEAEPAGDGANPSTETSTA